MRKLNIVAQNIIKDCRYINDSLNGKQVILKHKTYPEVQDTIRKVKILPGGGVKQVTFENSQPILIRRGDKFTLQITGSQANTAEDVPQQDTEDKIFEFFKNNPEPEDSAVHEFSQSLGIDEHEFEGMIYKILGSFLGYGKSIGFKGTYDPEQVAAGMKVEMEHTNNPKVALKITHDHLAEFDKYYLPYLKEMEAKASEEKLKQSAFLSKRMCKNN